MKRLLPLLLGMLCSTTLFARLPDDTTRVLADFLKRLDSIETSLHYKTGPISLGGIATIHVPEGFKFLEGPEAKYVVEDIWGNPPGEMPLGMLMPATSSATMGGYAYLVTYEAMGYVKDEDADKIDYDDLLKDLKEGNKEGNKERLKLGLQTLDLVGWAAKPYYDKDKKVLHWAKEFKVQDAEDNTLNYDIRVLGRKGVLTLQAVAGMSEIDSVNAHIGDVLGMVSFNEGNRYSDFNSGTDKVAAWTIGGLVAGKVLAKAGFFAVIGKFLKFIIIGLGLAGGAVWRFIKGRRKKDEEFVYEPQPAPAHNEEQQPPNAS